LTIVEFVNSLPGMEAASCPLTVRKKKAPACGDQMWFE